MRFGTDEVDAQAWSALVAQVVPALEADLTIVFVLKHLDFIRLAPGLLVFEVEALAIAGRTPAFAWGGFGRAIEDPVAAHTGNHAHPQAAHAG